MHVSVTALYTERIATSCNASDSQKGISERENAILKALYLFAKTGGKSKANNFKLARIILSKLFQWSTS
jgi:hypothetical protein